MPTHIPFSPGWFSVAVQALVVIAATGEACPSTTIAEGVDAHAVFLRRVLAQLGRATIVEAREGRGGGYRLIRSPDQITLAEIFQAVNCVDQPDELATNSCLQTKVMTVLDEVGAEAEARVLEVLQHYTLANIIERTALAQQTI